MTNQPVPVRLELVPTKLDRARATPSQEYYWYLGVQDADPSVYLQAVHSIEGALDASRLIECLKRFIARHDIYWTQYRLVDGRLEQYVVPPSDRRPAWIESLDRSSVPIEWAALVEQVVPEILAAAVQDGQWIGASVVRLAPERHLLVVLVHHMVSEEGLLSVMLEEVFSDYSGGVDHRPTLQFIDYAAALEQYARSPQGLAHQASRRKRLEHAVPLELPLDVPRDEWERRRDAAPYGIVAEPMHFPPLFRPLPAAVRATVVAASKREHTTPYVVYLAGLAYVLHHRTGQQDLSIESTYSPRPDYEELADVQGVFVTATPVRVRCAAAPSFAEMIRCTHDAVEAVRTDGPIVDYYQTVPHQLRRAVFNYVPLVPLDANKLAPGLAIAPQRRLMRALKRPWELNLVVVDTSDNCLAFATGSTTLFKRETIQQLFEQYVDVLATA